MNQKRFKPNLKIPIIKLIIWYLILGLVVWAFLGTALLLIGFTPLFLIVGIIYLFIKMTETVNVNKDHFLKTQNFIIYKRTKKIEYKDISYFDIEKGVIMKFKNGSVKSMDNSSAVPTLKNMLQEFGIVRKTVSTHNKSYSKKH